MTETKFTPGPWHIKESRGHDGEHLFWNITGDTEKYRGDLAHMQHNECISGTTREENDANALLVSAAPELYVALEEAIRELDMVARLDHGEPYNNPTFNAALAKARGE